MQTLYDTLTDGQTDKQMHHKTTDKLILLHSDVAFLVRQDLFQEVILLPFEFQCFAAVPIIMHYAALSRVFIAYVFVEAKLCKQLQN